MSWNSPLQNSVELQQIHNSDFRIQRHIQQRQNSRIPSCRNHLEFRFHHTSLVGMLTSSSQHVHVSDLRVLTYLVCHSLILCLFNYLSGIYFEMIDTLNIRVFCNIYQSFKVFHLQRHGISASEVQSKSKFKFRNFHQNCTMSTGRDRCHQQLFTRDIFTQAADTHHIDCL